MEKFKSLTSSSLMWVQFTLITHCQIPFISHPKTNSKVQLMRMIKNREIFLVQIATRPFPKHIYMSLRALLNSTLTRNEFGSFQTQPIHNIEGSKPCIYTFYTKTRQIPYYSILESIPVIFFFPSFFLFFSSSSSSSLLFSSLLSVFSLSFSKTKMRYLFWYYPYLILSPLYFNIFFLFISLFLSFGASLTFQSKEETSSLFPSSHLSLPQFSSLFPYLIFLISFFYYSLVLNFIFILNSIYQNPTLAYELIKL